MRKGQKFPEASKAKMVESKGQIQREKRKCKICGGEFEVTGKRRDSGKYCSLACYWKSLEKPRIKRNCLYCGKEFEIIISQKRKFCSNQCRAKYYSGDNSPFKRLEVREKISVSLRRIPRIEVSCPICGTKFIKKETESKRFCSRKCAGKGNGLAMIGRKLEISEEGRLNWEKRSANPEYRKKLSIGNLRALKNGTKIMPLGFRDEETQRKAQKTLIYTKRHGSAWEAKVYEYLLSFYEEREVKRQFEVLGSSYPIKNQFGSTSGTKRRQYFLDIALPDKKVDIEIDGEAFHKNKEKDKQRDDFLKSEGWKVIRIPAKWVSNNEYKEVLNNELKLY